MILPSEVYHTQSENAEVGVQVLQILRTMTILIASLHLITQVILTNLMAFKQTHIKCRCTISYLEIDYVRRVICIIFVTVMCVDSVDEVVTALL